MDAYARRRHRELTDLGSIVAMAFNDPKALEALQPPRRSTEQREPDWWELPAPTD